MEPVFSLSVHLDLQLHGISPFNANGIASYTACSSGSNLLAILCILRQAKRKNLCSVMFLYAQGNLKGPISHFKCVSLRHKSRITEYLRL